jgi:hypothetical protein
MKSLFTNKTNDGVLVYVEAYNRQEGTVLVDFIDSNEFSSFNLLLNLNKNIGDASMILITNYFQKRIQENTIYLITKETIDLLRDNNSIISSNIDSLIIGYELNIDSAITYLFEKAVSLNDFDFFLKGVSSGKSGDVNILPTSIKGKIQANIRNVGQGNWNELLVENSVLFVFDAGAPMRATKEEVLAIISNRENIYQQNKPILLISHWDVDHYHSLIAMSDETISNFSFAIFRDFRPTLTSRIVFGRFEKFLDKSKIILIPNEPKVKGKVPLKLLSHKDSQLLIFNASEHKDRNRSGIVLLIRTASSSIIFSGDIHYHQLSDFVLPYLNYEHQHNLIVPHHGGHAGKFNYSLDNKVKPCIAVTSVGKNKYGHPLEENKSQLKSIGFNQIKFTNIAKKDIEINL